MSGKTHQLRLPARLSLIVFGFVLGLVLLEIILRIWTNPFGYRVKGDEIVLPVNMQYVIRNPDNPKLDPLIIHTKNSLGFRGPEPPEDFDATLTIILIGGSTSEQLYISDGQTWAEQLANRLDQNFTDLWVNNAGFVGHSTYGHQILLDDAVSRIHPDVVLYLVGANELGLMDLGPYDRESLGQPDSVKGAIRWLSLRSEVVALAYNLFRAVRARNLAYVGGQFDLQDIPIHRLTPEELEGARQPFLGEPLEAYRTRLTNLVRSTRAYGIEPVLITQPALYGDFIDPTTGVDMGGVEISGKQSAAEWGVLELYNDVTRAVAAAEGVFLIDLAAQMPKDSPYYRDMIHYTNSGSAVVAEIVYPPLCRFLSETFGGAAAACPTE